METNTAVNDNTNPTISLNLNCPCDSSQHIGQEQQLLQILNTDI